MDDMYEDTSAVFGLSAAVSDEDSVDIYSGLDTSTSNDAEKPLGLFSPRVKESMDLYEEILTEERKSKDSTYEDLKSRFVSAQSQIEELRRRLQQTEMQNTDLNTENSRLKKNISALLKTARQEVHRKDEEIQRLNKGPGRARPPVNGPRDLPSARYTCSSGSTCKPPPPPQPLQLLQPPLPPPPPPPKPRPPSPPREDRLPKPPPPGEKSAPQPPPAACSGDPSRGFSEAAERTIGRSTCAGKSTSGSSAGRNDSERRTQPKHREEKPDGRRPSEPTDKKHKPSSAPNRECRVMERVQSHRVERETAKNHSCRSHKSGDRRDVERQNKPERHKSPPPPDSSQRKASSSHGSEDAKDRSRERQQAKAKRTAPGSGPVPAGARGSRESSKDGSEPRLRDPEREHRKHKHADDKHRRSADGKEPRRSCPEQRGEGSGESSQGKGAERDHQRSAERRPDGGNRRGDKRCAGSERSRENERTAKEQDQVTNKEGERRTNRNTEKPPPGETLAESSGAVEENSPSRKLCFMETLNLTLSPVKKLRSRKPPGRQEAAAANQDAESSLEDHSEQPNIEDMCVIDEIDSTLTETEADLTEDGRVAKSPTRLLDSADPEGADGTGAAETHDAVVLGEPPGVTTTQTTSARGPLQSTDTPTSSEGVPIASQERGAASKPGAQSPESDTPEPSHCPDGGPGSVSENHKCNILKLSDPETERRDSTSLAKPVELESNAEPPQTTLPCSPTAGAGGTDLARPLPGEDPVEEVDEWRAKPEGRCASASGRRPSAPPPAPANSVSQGDVRRRPDAPVDEAVSSTIAAEASPEGGELSSPVVLPQTDPEGDSVANEPSSSSGCVGVSKVSSTTEETAVPGKQKNGQSFTPRKAFDPRDRHEEKEDAVKPSSSVPLFHDEDSMMRTLAGLSSIPDAISPLRSPMRLTKRGPGASSTKPPHVKSLRKDFSSRPPVSSHMTLDVSKEHKYLGKPQVQESQNKVETASALPSCPFTSELEEGEILSESEEEEEEEEDDDDDAVCLTPSPQMAKSIKPAQIKQSPKSFTNTPGRKSEETGVPSEDAHETAAASSSGSPSPNRSRFKTVCPSVSRASFSTTEEVMETFRKVRSQIRKKYMKLHKIFPKKSFYGMMNNSHESFLEFVDGAGFCAISDEAGELKAKLRRRITSVFDKLSNNGIVKRIFELQAADLKQKLWHFVDVQLDYLFKEIHSTLTSFCKAAPANHSVRAKAEYDDATARKEKPPKRAAAAASPKPRRGRRKEKSLQIRLRTIRPHPIAPCRTGLGSRGKDIRISAGEDGDPAPNPKRAKGVAEVHPSTPERSHKASVVVSQTSSDFEILTEQQASSLTFNLARDSQMGEIFKCLLQGSDLLESGVAAGEGACWSISTPRKDVLPGESLISFTSPTRFGSPGRLTSPSKLVTTWSAISPRVMSSPGYKVRTPFNPALFDESCLLELPLDARAGSQAGPAPLRSYSILAEDLAVSLTIPSPLKSDGHLSFLQPSAMSAMSTPESVISAHLSEDALLDGDDALAHDLHLALDTDNSTCGSGGGGSTTEDDDGAPTPFQFKPHLPMRAVVVERSNDHFIVKIRQTPAEADATLVADDSLSRTLTEDGQRRGQEDADPPECSPGAAPASFCDEPPPGEPGPPEAPPPASDAEAGSETTQNSDAATPASGSCPAGAPQEEAEGRKAGTKRRKRQKKGKAKQAKMEEEGGREGAEKAQGWRRKSGKAKPPKERLSPASLSAKNVVKKKGAVVISWTREEDRAILLEMKTRGASRETFSTLSEKLDKPSSQVAHRFAQLMKLFKKQGKM